MTEAVAYGRLPLSIIMGGNRSWLVDSLDFLVPEQHIPRFSAWFLCDGWTSLGDMKLSLSPLLVTFKPIPRDNRYNLANFVPDTCDQVFLFHDKFIVYCPLPTYEYVNPCSADDPMQSFHNIRHRKCWVRDGFPTLDLGLGECGLSCFPRGLEPDPSHHPQIIHLSLFNL